MLRLGETCVSFLLKSFAQNCTCYCSSFQNSIHLRLASFLVSKHPSAHPSLPPQPLKPNPRPRHNQLMLLGMYPLLQLLEPLILPQRHLLRHNRIPRIHLRNNLMDHNPRPLQPLFPPSLPRPLNRARARKLPRQRRVQVDNRDTGGGDGCQERGRDDVHPARADNEVCFGVVIEDEFREVGVVLRAGVFEVRRVGFLVRDEVVVGSWYPGFRGALEAVGCFAAVHVIVNIELPEGMCM